LLIAGLLYLALRARRSLGAYRIPLETGLLIPSGKSDNRSCEVMLYFSGNRINQGLACCPHTASAVVEKEHVHFSTVVTLCPLA
jgi:hypothetical protein